MTSLTWLLFGLALGLLLAEARDALRRALREARRRRAKVEVDRLLALHRVEDAQRVDAEVDKWRSVAAIAVVSLLVSWAFRERFNPFGRRRR